MKLSARSVRTDHYPVVTGEKMFALLNRSLHHYLKRKSPVFLLTDNTVAAGCLPILISRSPALAEAIILQVEPGEGSKTLTTAATLWQQLAAHNANRQSLLINLGGGAISDLGGFVASGFQRGIDTLHIPTTLIAQVDASIGGKTAVNLDQVKNQVGTFYAPAGVYIWPGFLQTLPVGQLRAGLAEVGKTALVRDAQFWHWLQLRTIPGMLEIPVEDPFWLNLIHRTIRIKLEIVRHDPFERRQRKLLNFGHTIGHALESWSLRRKSPLLHGEAIAAGMICEATLSVALTALPETDQQAIARWIQSGFDPVPFSMADEEELLTLMQRDKKNAGEEIRFTLLAAPGKGKIHQTAPRQLILEALRDYAST